MEVRILPLGGMDFPKHRLVRCQDPEKMLFSPAWAVLIRHPTLGNVLYDTGHSPAFLQGEMQRVLYDYPVRGGDRPHPEGPGPGGPDSGGHGPAHPLPPPL